MAEEIRRVLVCAPLLPEYDRESGSRRLFDLIDFLQQARWTVTFGTRQSHGGERYVDLLQQRGVETYTGFDRAFERAISVNHFDIAILAFWYVAEECLPKIRSLSPHTRILVDSIDLHFLRNARRALSASDEGVAPGTLDSAYGSEMVRELNAYAAADAVLAVSDKEAALIDDLTGQPGLACVVADCEDIEPSAIPFGERKGILFLGNFNHPPNVGAAEHLLCEIVPKVDPTILREHPLYIVGNALRGKLRCFEEHPNVRMVGWVPSILPYVQRARMTVVPLRYGAGTKRKVIQALMAGTPTVASTIGVEGLSVRHRQHVLVADDPSEFAAHIGKLARDEQLWLRLSRQGRSLMCAQHGRDVVFKQLQRSLATAIGRAPKKLRLADLVVLDNAPPDAAYARLVTQIIDLVKEALPTGAHAAVISKGDDALLQFEGVSARHFPSTPDGVYAGYYPADSAAAIAQLEALRAAGVEYLLVPRTSFWWLDYYTQFREHLERHYRLPVAQKDTCLIFDLHREVP